jgi:hypothetical protein
MKSMLFHGTLLTLCFSLSSIKITYSAASDDVWSLESGQSKLVTQPTFWKLLRQDRKAADISFYEPATMEEFKRTAIIFFNLLLNGIAPDFTTVYSFYQNAPLSECLQQIQDTFWTNKLVNYHIISPQSKPCFTQANNYSQEISLSEANMFIQIAARAILCKFEQHQGENSLWWLLAAAYEACNLKMKADMVQKRINTPPKRKSKRASMKFLPGASKKTHEQAPPSGSSLQHFHPDFECKDAVLRGIIITPYCAYFESLERTQEGHILSLLDKALKNSLALVTLSS